MPRNVIRAVMLGAIFLASFLVLMAQQSGLLMLEGPQGQATVIQVHGKNYVEVDELARITGGSLRFAANRIIVTLPAHADVSVAPVGYSRSFLGSGIETMRQILEWHAALKSAIERGYPLSEEWIGHFRRQIQSSLKQVEAAPITDMDHKVVPLLANEFDNMSALTGKYQKLNASRDYIAPNSLSTDPLEQKLLTCWQSLASMASSNQFVDDGSCH